MFKSTTLLTTTKALAVSLLLAGCSNLSFTNIASLSPSYQYITLHTDDNTVYRTMRDELVRQGITVISPETPTSELANIVKVVSANYQQVFANQQNQLQLNSSFLPNDPLAESHQISNANKFLNQALANSDTSNNNTNISVDTSLSGHTKLDSNTALTNDELTTDNANSVVNNKASTTDSATRDHSSTTNTTNNKNTNTRNNRHTTAKTQASTTELEAIKTIAGCKGPYLTYSCIERFLPSLRIYNYQRSSKTLSLYDNGSTAQQLAIATMNTQLAIPYLGSIDLNDIVTDLQLNDTFSPLANIRRDESLNQVYLEAIAQHLTNKIVYIFEDQASKQQLQVSERKRQFQQQAKEQQILIRSQQNRK